MKALGLTSAAATVAACAPVAAGGIGTPVPESADHMGDHAAAAAQATPTPEPTKTPEEKVAEMDAMHEAGIKAFPAPTQGKGNQILEYTMDGDVKVFELTCKEVDWEVEPGKMTKAWTYNGQLPGPQIRVTEGDKVRIIVKNELPESTAVHWHGLDTPNAMDGVPFITQPPIKPGEEFVYEFVATPAGSHMYHSHHNAAYQVSMGLLGAFIVEEKEPTETYALDYVMILNDGPHGFTLNGKGFPATEPLVAKKGDKIRVRYMNEGQMIHPMHLHGMRQKVIAIDGHPYPTPYFCDTPMIAPGQRIDVEIECYNPGTWAFHCHILPHAESPHGMFGMVTVLIVEE
jgi:FtsP/CotA-like multicopper oxidase with cupredoxin domain